jgi:hypothetical protein
MPVWQAAALLFGLTAPLAKLLVGTLSPARARGAGGGAAT